MTQRGSAELGPSASRAFPVRGATKYSWCDGLFDPDPAWTPGAGPAECGTADCGMVDESAGVRAGRGAAAAAAAAARALSPQEADALTIAVPRVFVPVGGAGGAAGHGGGEGGGGGSSRGASPPLPDYHACFQGF